MNSPRLDRYDLNILRVLAADGRIAKSRLAEEVCLSVSAAWERMKRLEDLGYIQGYRALVDCTKLFKHSQVIVQVSLDRHTAQHMRRFEERVARAPEITHCYATGGGVDYVLHVVARDIDQYQRFIDQLLLEDLGIERYYTYVVTKVVKQETVRLPDLEALDP